MAKRASVITTKRCKQRQAVSVVNTLHGRTVLTALLQMSTLHF